MKRSIKHLFRISLKTIYFNFRYLPFKQAISLPILISKNFYLRKALGKIILDCPVQTGLVRLGFGDCGIFDDKRSRSIWDVSGTVIFKGKTRIGHGTKISVGEGGVLVLGENFTVTAESSIVAYSEVCFGDNCLLSWDILIMDTDLHKVEDSTGTLINEPRPIRIGNDVWIGSRCLILKSSIIPDGSVIGANSTISKKLETENGIYVGNPVRCVKENIKWKM